MYKKHFGFRERPFQLVPNPAYLFLSKSHEEALAHLNYATSQGDGFVEITGEVGTGKTTLCRAFIESLDQTTEVAYIFNPMLTATELLAAIHDEFGISCEPGSSTKALIDSLNRFLIAKKAEGKRVLLIIDEAQNLGRDVLEQVRLLSNLETNTEKLIQIILVGQPELGEMLDSFELRQLGQRITLSAHLTPLSYGDTVRYVYHRIHIASHGAKVQFSRPALRRIYHYSGGVPRLIHIVCDRALLVAYTMNRQHVTGGIVRVAVRELSSRAEWKRGARGGRIWVPAALAAGLIFAAAISVYQWGASFYQPDFLSKQVVNSEKPADTRNPPLETRAEASLPASPAPMTNKAVAEGSKLETASPATPERRVPISLPFVSRQAAFAGALAPWGVTATVDSGIQASRHDPAFFRAAAEQNGFEIYRFEGNLDLLLSLNLPAILISNDPAAGSVRYLLLIQREGEKLIFLSADEPGAVGLDPAGVTVCWSGVAYIPWKNFLSCRGTIPIGTNESSILALKQLLKNAGYDGMSPGPAYDEGTRMVVRRVQEKYGLPVDGMVGSLTKILLYNEQNTFDIPYLTRGIPTGEVPSSVGVPMLLNPTKALFN